jgi:hypothetical protein
MTSFIGYINNVMIELTVYYTSHILIDTKVMDIVVSTYLYRTMMHKNMNMFASFSDILFLFENKY